MHVCVFIGNARVFVFACAVGPTQGITKRHLVSHEKLEACRMCVCFSSLYPNNPFQINKNF